MKKGAKEQAEHRLDPAHSRSKNDPIGKKKSKAALIEDIMGRTLHSHFHAAMSRRFGDYTRGPQCVLLSVVAVLP